MNSDDLDDLLARETARMLPPAPDLRSAVRREISRRQERSIWNRIFPVLHWRELMVVPRFAVAAVALAVVAGVIPSVLVSRMSAQDEVERARASLHLNVFMADHANRAVVMFTGPS
jgi:hypothetical protein